MNQDIEMDITTCPKCGAKRWKSVKVCNKCRWTEKITIPEAPRIDPWVIWGPQIINIALLILLAFVMPDSSGMGCLIPLGLGMMVFVWITAQYNCEQIKSYLQRHGNQLVSIKWAPFGPGWLGEKDSGIYEVEYVDRMGHYQVRHCKVNIFSGVYMSED